MEVELIDKVHGRCDGDGKCGFFTNIGIFIASIICGVLHISAMNAFYATWKDSPGCCGETDSNVRAAYQLCITGIVFAITAAVVSIFVSFAKFFKEFEQVYGELMAFVKGLLNNFSMTAATEILIGSVMGLCMLCFGYATKDSKAKRSGSIVCCFGLSLFFIIGQIIACACYIALPAASYKYCWTNDSGVGDDGMKNEYMRCSSDVCAEISSSPTNVYTNSYGTVTEYCKIDCCYWKT